MVPTIKTQRAINNMIEQLNFRCRLYSRVTGKKPTTAEASALFQNVIETVNNPVIRKALRGSPVSTDPKNEAMYQLNLTRRAVNVMNRELNKHGRRK